MESWGINYILFRSLIYGVEVGRKNECPTIRRRCCTCSRFSWFFAFGFGSVPLLLWYIFEGQNHEYHHRTRSRGPLPLRVTEYEK